MRPLTEKPELFGVKVVLYRKNNSELGYVTKIPEGYYPDEDRAFCSVSSYEDTRRRNGFQEGYNHGSLPWGATRNDGGPMHHRYIGWDYWYPTITEEDDVGDLVGYHN